MLTEGGMHVPFVISYPEKIKPGQEYPHPISALDVAATAASQAGIQTNPQDFDGVDLIPYLSGKNSSPPHDALMWRWVSQSAIREGDWKLLRGGDREYLFNLNKDIEEKHNLATAHPDIATRLRQRLLDWSSGLTPPGLATGAPSKVWNDYFDFYLDGKAPTPLREKFLPNARADSTAKSKIPWIVRNGTMMKVDDTLEIQPLERPTKQSPFLARNGLKLNSPVSIEMNLMTNSNGSVLISWRTQTEKDFAKENRVSLAINETSDWQTIKSVLPSEGRIIHVRVQFPNGKTVLKRLNLSSQQGNQVELFK